MLNEIKKVTPEEVQTVINIFKKLNWFPITGYGQTYVEVNFQKNTISLMRAHVDNLPLNEAESKYVRNS